MAFAYTADQLQKEIVIHAPLSAKQEKYLNDNTNEIIVWGGAASSGKSFVSGLNILINGLEDEHYRAGIVRKTKEQLKGAGSLFDECTTMYQHYPVKRQGNEMKFIFEEGAEIKFSYSDKPSDKHNFQGWQCTEFIVDEAQQLNEENVIYLLSRLRSKSDKLAQLKLTCNPSYDSYLRVWLEKAGYLDTETGNAIPEMDGVTTWYCEVFGEIHFRKSKKEALEEFAYANVDPIPFTFYSANVHDNPWMCKHQPRYISKLMNLPPVERARLYEGNWYATEEASGYFKREWCDIIEPNEVCLESKRARAWDRAGTLPSTATPDPDFSVGIKGYLDKEGYLVIEDMVRFRDRPAKVLHEIKLTGIKDGRGCVIGIPQDVGSAGKESVDVAHNALLREGLICLICKARANKLARFEPFAILAQNRKVKVVKGDWNKAFFDELEKFDGLNKTRRGYHDDVPDACSDLYQMLVGRLLIPSIKVSNRQIHSTTKLG